MTWKSKRRAPDKPTRKAVHAAFEMQRPLDQDAAPLVRKKPRTGTLKLNWDESLEIGDRND